MFPTPTRLLRARCRRCRKLAAVDRMVDGLGSDCAALLGLTVASPRLRAEPQTGPTLFDNTDEDDTCEGWDHPAG